MSTTVRPESPNIVDRGEFRGIVGEDLDVFATIWSADDEKNRDRKEDGQESSKLEEEKSVSVPIILQEDDTILVLLYNYSGILRITKGGPKKAELHLSFGAMNLPASVDDGKSPTSGSPPPEPVEADDDDDDVSTNFSTGGSSIYHDACSQIYEEKPPSRVRVQNFYTGEISFSEDQESKERKPSSSMVKKSKKSSKSAKIDNGLGIHAPKNNHSVKEPPPINGERNSSHSSIGSHGSKSSRKVSFQHQAPQIEYLEYVEVDDASNDDDGDDQKESNKSLPQQLSDEEDSKSTNLEMVARRHNPTPTRNKKNVVLKSVPSIDKTVPSIDEGSERTDTTEEQEKSDDNNTQESQEKVNSKEKLSPKGASAFEPAMRSPSILKNPMITPKPPTGTTLPNELPFSEDFFEDDKSYDFALNDVGKDNNSQQKTTKDYDMSTASIGFEDLEMIARRFGPGGGNEVDRKSVIDESEGTEKDNTSGSDARDWTNVEFRPKEVGTKDVETEESERLAAKFSASTVARFNSSAASSHYSEWDKAESDYATPLHEACDSPMVTFAQLEDLLISHPRAVKKQDDQGRLPLHILASNQDLIFEGGESGRETATEIAKYMMDLFPDAIFVEDDAGRVPFTDPIHTWIEWTYSNEFCIQPVGNFSSNASSFAARLASSFLSSSSRSSNSAAAKKARKASEKLEKDEEDIWTRFPPAELSDEVEWCFDMLSVALETCGGKTAGGGNRPQLSYKKQLQDREKLSKNVAAIPLLLKTIFLIESVDARKRIFNLPILRRILLCPESVGEWLTAMLITPPIGSRSAVTYFEVISNITVVDFIGDFRKSTPGDIEAFKKARKIVYDELFELGGTIPSLVVLNEKEIERAASTKAVYFIMSVSLTQPLVVALVVTDFVMQITLMLAFRSSVIMPEIAELTEDLLIPGNHVIIAICSYLLFRQVVDMIALGRVSRKVLRRHVMDLWYLFDISCICLTLSASILVWKEGINQERGILHALTLGLLWIRLLTFLKIVNEKTATFILALVQIIRDSRYFLVVFTAVIFLFSDMLFVIFNSDRENLCEGDVPPAAQDYCSDRPYSAYMRTYAIILGNIAVEEYRESAMISIIFVFITFFALIIMLNVLIAVLSASYDKANRKSASLFRRARIEFVASHTALESLVRPKKKSKSLFHYVGQRAIGILILLSMLSTSITAELYLVGSSWAVRGSDDAVVFLVLYASLSVLLSLGVWGVAFFTVGGFLKHLLPGYAAKAVRWSDEVLHKVSKFTAFKMFGLHDIYGIDKVVDGDDDLNKIGDEDEVAQLKWIREELNKTEKSLRWQMQHTEDRIRRQMEAMETYSLNPSSPNSPRGRGSLREPTTPRSSGRMSFRMAGNMSGLGNMSSLSPMRGPRMSMSRPPPGRRSVVLR